MLTFMPILKKKKSKKSQWRYCVHGQDFLACYDDSPTAMTQAKKLVKKRKDALVEVEKVWSDFPGHSNPWRKGAGHVFVHNPWDGSRGDGRTVLRPQDGSLDPSQRRR